jgi:hypothetical protein
MSTQVGSSAEDERKAIAGLPCLREVWLKQAHFGGELSVGEKPDSSPSKRDGKAPADKDAVKSKGTDSKKTPSKVASS